MRDQIVAGNWKMNNDQSQTQTLLNALKNHKKPENVRVMVAPAFTQLSQCVTLLEEDMISVTAQNVNAAASGAYTGEVSVEIQAFISSFTSTNLYNAAVTGCWLL